MDYAVVELMGHVRIAGVWSIQDGMLLVQNIIGEEPPAEKWFGMGAIYAITPMSRADAEKAVAPWAPTIAVEEVMSDDPIDWLREDDRLFWAFAEARGHEGGSTAEDEADARAVLDRLQTMRANEVGLPF